MALPFVAGLAVGAGVELLFTQRKKIKESFENHTISADLQKGLDKGKEVSHKALQCVQSTLEKTAQSLKDKIESKEDSKVQKGEISQKEAIKNTAIATLEGGIITACGIAAANSLGSTQSPLKNLLEATTLVAIGMASIYGIQTLANPKAKSNL